MAYERINWQNEPSEATALNDVNLNKMDSAIYELDGKATTTETAITALQDGKVDKVNGKGLSQVDNVTVTQHVAYGTVVSTIKTYGQDGTEVTSQVCNGIVVDSALSNSSTNPVQNKVVKSAIDEKSTVAISDTLETGTTLANITIDGTTTAIKGSDIEVDEELSPTSTNPVENKAIYDALNNLLPSKTVSGNPISISDASGFNAKALTVSMNPIQDLHGYSNPWAGGAGKNIGAFPQYVRQSSEGFAISVEDNGYIHYVGTAENGYAILTNNIPISLSSGTVITFSRTKSVNHQHYLDLTYTDDTHEYIRILLGETSGTYTLQKASKRIQLVCLQLTIGTSYDETIGFQLEIGSTATSYAPYSNICPISGRTEASVTRTSENLWGGEALADDIVSKVPNATKDTTEKVVAYAASNIASITNLFTKFKPNTRYTAIIRMKDGVPNMRFEYTDETSTGIYAGATVSIAGKTVKCISGQWQTGSSSMYYDQSGIFEGVKTADDFEPYTAETKTHQYSETIYGGFDDFVNGGATSTMGMVDLGTLTWTKQTGTKTYFRTANEVGNMKKNTSPILTQGLLCSSYIEESWTNTVDRQGYNGTICVGWINKSYIAICDESKNDLTAEQFKTAMDGVQLCYELATPTTISTSAEEITLLKGNNVLSTNADDMELKYSVSLDSLLPSTTRTLSKSAPIEEKTEVVKEPEEETKEER